MIENSGCWSLVLLKCSECGAEEQHAWRMADGVGGKQQIRSVDGQLGRVMGLSPTLWAIADDGVFCRRCKGERTMNPAVVVP